MLMAGKTGYVLYDNATIFTTFFLNFKTTKIKTFKKNVYAKFHPIFIKSECLEWEIGIIFLKDLIWYKCTAKFENL